MTEREIFLAALERQNLVERDVFLDEACGTDAGLRRRVEDLLNAHFTLASAVKEAPDKVMPTSPNVESDTRASQEDQTGTVIAGRYKLRQLLGEGGMGRVYLAEQTQPIVRLVAIKLIKPGMDSTAVLARFEAERQALALMDHPNIAKVLDAGTTADHRPFFVMELVKGIPITRYCDQQHLSPNERLQLFLQVCHAVQHAHQKGIIHRDLKPSNVLIALYDGRPVPKVIDFGVAKAISQRLTERTLFTEVGQMVGTVEYMAPEQADLNSLDIDTRADIYSLGVLLYELLAGSPPFTSKQLRGAGFTEMMRIIKEVEPPKPSTKISTAEELPTIAANRHFEPRRLTKLVSGDLDWIVMKALEKERSRRYESASSLALDIEHFLAAEPVRAGPPSALYRMRKFVKRHRSGTAVAAVVALAVLLGLVGTSVGFYEANEQRKLVEEQKKAVEKQRDQIARANEATEKNAAATRSVIAEFLLKIGDDEFSAIPQFADIRKDLVDRAVKRYQEFLAIQPDNDSLAFDAAITYQRSANLYRMMDQFDAARPLYERSIALFRKLLDPHPKSSDYLTFLSSTLSDYGDLLERAEGPSAAEPKYREAVAISRRVVATSKDPGDKLILAKALLAWGDALRVTSHFAEAVVQLQEAATILSDLADETNPRPLLRFYVVLAWDALAQAAREGAQPTVAENALKQAQERGKKAVIDLDNNPDARYTLAWANVELGLLLSLQSKPNEARQAIDKAVAALDQLVKEFSKVAHFRRKLAEALTARGEFSLSENRPAEAKADSKNAIDLLEQLDREAPKGAKYHAHLAKAYALAGKCALNQNEMQLAKVRLEQAQQRYAKALAINPAYSTIKKESEENQALLQSIK
jgi:serine/threonine protein kinase